MIRRFSLAGAVLLTLAVAAAASAQTARATGTVRDINGRPIKGATVRAVNREASPPEIASTTDDRGRWAMIGLRTGQWTFQVEAPGYAPVEGTAPIRVAGTPPLMFTLARDPGPIPGALDRSILQQVSAANALRDRGQYEQALTAYRQIREANPKLTSIAMVEAGIYRRQAASQSEPAARRALLERAMTTYRALLEDEATGERARSEIAATQAEVDALPR